MALRAVTDPALLEQLNGAPAAGPRPVQDPALLAQLNAPAQPAASSPNLAMAPVGGAEMLLSGATGLLAQPIAGLGGLAAGATNYFNRLTGRDTPDIDEAGVIHDIRQQLTYQPRTDSAKAGGALIGRGLGYVDQKVAKPALESIGSVSPTAENIVRTAVPAGVEMATTAFPMARGLGGGMLRSAADSAPTVVADAADVGSAMSKPLYQPPARTPITPPVQAPGSTAEDVLARQMSNSPQSMGAAAASPNLMGVSPELKEAVVKTAQKTGGAINPEVLARHVEANTLPVPISLTEGMATQSPQLISLEQNMRGRFPQLAERHNQINQQLGQNVQAIRDQVGPDVFTTNPVEHADTLIASYKSKNQIAQDQIGKLYQQLRDANGGQFPVDARALLDSASVQLHKDLLFDHAPKAVMSTLSRLAEKGNMTFENFESLRTNLARIQRSQTADGNEKAAAGVIRDAMEQLPLQPQAAALKPLADSARSAARAQFQALEADPAYKAAVTDAVPPDRFIARYVLNAPRDDVLLMRNNLAHDPAAVQTMGVAALDHLREAARLTPHYEGNFAAAGYNKALLGLSPKMQALLPPQSAEALEKLGNVARYATAQPKGSFVNNSNTFVAGAADYGAGALEGMANFASGGIPVGTWGRKAIGKVREGKTVRNALQVGAGLGKLDPPP